MTLGLGLAIVCRANADTAVVPATPDASAPASTPYEVLISVKDQRLAVVEDGELVARYPVSTSKFGTGDQNWSYKTPLGKMRVFEKIGDNFAPGAVIHHHSATGEVLPVNAPGRDPIVTRIISLEGLEAQNEHARSRGIYIHGTPEERTIGSPVSWGCIRMRSKDVIRVFNEIPLGTIVSILPDKLPHMHKWEPPKVEPVQPVELPEANEAIAAAKTPEHPGKAAVAATPGAALITAAPEVEKVEKVEKVAKIDRAEKAKISAIGSYTEKSYAEKLAPIGEKPAADVAENSVAPPEESASGHGTGEAWRALKGSYLLATLPSGDSQPKKSTQ